MSVSLAWPLSLVLSFALLLLLATSISLFWAFKRLKAKPLRFSGVLLASVLCNLAVLALLLEVNIQRQEPTKQQSLSLITLGTTKAQMASVANQPNVYALPLSLKLSQLTSAEHVQQLSTFNQLQPLLSSADKPITQLNLLGSGLSKQQWQQIQQLMGPKWANLAITQQPFAHPLGLVAMQWQPNVSLGQYSQISGQLAAVGQTPEQIYQLSLLDPMGETLATKRLKAGEAFTFNFQVKSQGQWLYQLTLSPANNQTLLAKEPVAISVTAQKELRLLIKQSAPSFETRHLVRWATQHGAQVVVISTISQDKHIRQDYNLSEAQRAEFSAPFSPQALQKFDWLYLDGRALLALTAEQQQAIKQAVQQGLGLFVQADSSLVEKFADSSLAKLIKGQLSPLSQANYQAVPVWPNSHIEQALPLIKGLIEWPSAKALVTARQKPIVAVAPLGLGKVAVSLNNNSYNWRLQGDNNSYSHYWQYLLHHTNRVSEQTRWLSSAANPVAFIGEQHRRCVLSKQKVQAARVNFSQQSQPLQLSQAQLQPSQHCAPVYFSASGWHKLSATVSEQQTTQVTESDSYVYPRDSWQVWQQANHTLATKAVLQNKTAQGQQSYQTQLDRSLFWWCLVLSAIGLWLERKTFIRSA